MKMIRSGILVISILFTPWVVLAQNTLTLTTTSTSTALSNDPVLGCGACATIQGPTFPFPDTSQPIFSGDSRAAQLPAIIANALPPNNQFGVGVPAGNNGMPLSSSIPSSLSEGGLIVSTDNQIQSTPLSGGRRSHSLSSRIDQTTPGGTVSGGDQTFSILFSINSLTDPDGNLVGDATGTFTQVIDGVTTEGTVQFNTTDGFRGTNLHQ